MPTPNHLGDRKVWLITDRHHNHPNMIPFCGRPEDFSEQIIENCKKKIQPQDLVIDLGDIIFRNAATLPEIQADLPGTWILIKGNHDKKSLSYYMNSGYSFACDSFNWYPIAFSHYPLEKLPDKCTINIHGHTHNATDERILIHDKIVIQPWHVRFALENEGYGPIDLHEFLRKKGHE